MEDMISLRSLIGALVYSAVGLILFFITFFGMDRAIPRFSLWEELIVKQNRALAVFLGAIAIGISIIVSAAIRG